MKKMKKLVTLGIILFAGIFSTSIQAMRIAEKNSWTAWYRKTYVSDYLPNWMRSWIPQARVRDMFMGTWSYLNKIDNPQWTQAEVEKFVTGYTQWIEQYKNIINEGSFITPDSIKLGIPDTILGFWGKTRFNLRFYQEYADFANNKVLMDGINEIIEKLEQLGAKLNPEEEREIKKNERLYLNARKE